MSTKECRKDCDVYKDWKETGAKISELEVEINRQDVFIEDMKARNDDLSDEVSRQAKSMILLAKLSADKPMFFSPLIACKAAAIRDEILKAVTFQKKE